MRDINNRLNKAIALPNLQENVNMMIRAIGSGQPVINTLQNDNALIKAFKETPEVYSIISYLATARSKVKFKMFKGSEDNKGDQINKHEIIDLLNNPNNQESYHELVKRRASYWYVLGNSYLNAFVPIGKSKPTKLYCMPGQGAQIKISNNKVNGSSGDFSEDFRVGDIAKYIFNVNNYELNIDSEFILHKRNTNLDVNNGSVFFGMSPLVSQEKPISSLLANYEAQIALTQKRGAMGIISSRGNISENAIPMTPHNEKDVYKKFYEEFGLSSDQYQMLITHHPLEYTKIAMDIKELQINENNIASFRAICRALNFPSVILNDPDNSKFDNVRMMEKQLWENHLIPMIDDDFLDLTNWLKTWWKEDFIIVPDYSNVDALKQDLETMNKILGMQFDRGGLTPNELRKANGLPESDEGYMNKYYIKTMYTELGGEDEQK